MKQLKKIIFSTVVFYTLNIYAFAESGFEFILSLPMGITIDAGESIEHNIKDKNEYISVNSFGADNIIGFHTGIETQIGYMFQVVDNFSISLLGDFGYRYGSIKANYTYMLDDGTNKILSYKNGDKLREEPIESYVHNFKIGLFPKFNINAFSIGIGGGIIIPISAKHIVGKSQLGDSTTAQFENNQLPIGFYIKLALDYSIFITDTSAINIGLYGAFTSIGDSFITDTYYKGTLPENAKAYYERIFIGIDFGVQIGYRFAPKTF